jgi:hypothetical protein
MNYDQRFLGTRFYGDGRLKVDPPTKLTKHHGKKPMRVRRSTARQMINKLIEKGVSYHSEAGATLWVLAEFCEARKAAYRIEPTTVEAEAKPGVKTTIGYSFHISKQVQEMLNEVRS